jgi:transcriptional regulator of heat shock response
MGNDDDFRERRRREEREEEKQKLEAELKERLQKKNVVQLKPNVQQLAKEISTDKIDEMLARAEPMIEQINHLYQMYFSGVERKPPVERRSQLDQLMAVLMAMSKPTSAYQFKFTTINNHYVSMRDRWDRLCKELESGKLKRPAGGGSIK